MTSSDHTQTTTSTSSSRLLSLETADRSIRSPESHCSELVMPQQRAGPREATPECSRLSSTKIERRNGRVVWEQAAPPTRPTTRRASCCASTRISIRTPTPRSSAVSPSSTGRTPDVRTGQRASLQLAASGSLPKSGGALKAERRRTQSRPRRQSNQRSRTTSCSATWSLTTVDDRTLPLTTSTGS